MLRDKRMEKKNQAKTNQTNKPAQTNTGKINK
jgi:hypothetical protein